MELWNTGTPGSRPGLEHIPFVTAMRTPGWSEARNLGQGPDYFYRYLQQARAQLPDGHSIRRHSRGFGLGYGL